MLTLLSAGNVTIILTLISYIVLVKSKFFNYHVTSHLNPSINDYQSESVNVLDICYKTILKKMWCYGMSVLVTFAITLSVYPGVTVLIESEGKGHGNKWNGKFNRLLKLYVVHAGVVYCIRG